jgi:hypothetical protein
MNQKSKEGAPIGICRGEPEGLGGYSDSVKGFVPVENEAPQFGESDNSRDSHEGEDNPIQTIISAAGRLLFLRFDLHQ